MACVCVGVGGRGWGGGGNWQFNSFQSKVPISSVADIIFMIPMEYQYM